MHQEDTRGIHSDGSDASRTTRTDPRAPPPCADQRPSGHPSQDLELIAGPWPPYIRWRGAPRPLSTATNSRIPSTQREDGSAVTAKSDDGRPPHTERGARQDPPGLYRPPLAPSPLGHLKRRAIAPPNTFTSRRHGLRAFSHNAPAKSLRADPPPDPSPRTVAARSAQQRPRPIDSRSATPATNRDTTFIFVREISPPEAHDRGIRSRPTPRKPFVMTLKSAPERPPVIPPGRGQNPLNGIGPRPALPSPRRGGARSASPGLPSAPAARGRWRVKTRAQDARHRMIR